LKLLRDKPFGKLSVHLSDACSYMLCQQRLFNVSILTEPQYIGYVIVKLEPSVPRWQECNVFLPLNFAFLEKGKYWFEPCACSILLNNFGLKLCIVSKR